MHASTRVGMRTHGCTYTQLTQKGAEHVCQVQSMTIVSQAEDKRHD